MNNERTILLLDRIVNLIPVLCVFKGLLVFLQFLAIQLQRLFFAVTRFRFLEKHQSLKDTGRDI